jgi:hypothetical protein
VTQAAAGCASCRLVSTPRPTLLPCSKPCFGPPPLHEPIPLPNGRQIVTLNEFIKTLPIATQDLPNWQFAIEMLIDAADHGWPHMVAHIVFLSELET